MVVLVTDGVETCGGDPLKQAALFRRLGFDVKFFVVGFDLAPDKVAAVEAIANAGDGKFLNARDAHELSKVFTSIELASFGAPLEPVVSRAHFFDDFSGNELSADWEVLNPDTSSYVVEKGELLILNGSEVSLSAGSVPNLFRLKKPMPEGDWQITMRLQLDVQTRYEWFGFGLHKDQDNHLMAGGWVGVNGSPQVHGPFGKKCPIG
jgi:hypothetical protein